MYGFTEPNGVISTICSQLETLEKRAINFNIYSYTFHHNVDACVEFYFLKKEFLNLTIKYAAIILHYYCDQPSSFSQSPLGCRVQCSTECLDVVCGECYNLG